MISEGMDSERLPNLLVRMLKEQGEAVRDSAFALSGGIDSSLLLIAIGKRNRAYSIGTEGSQDFAYADGLCRFLGTTLNKVTVDEDDILEASSIVKKIDPEIPFLDLGFETVLALLLSSIREDSLVTGQGADEIFYGYAKFSDGREENNLKSLTKLNSVTLPRERKIADYFGKTLIAPYMQNGIPEYFSGLHRNIHTSLEKNKIILREAGRMEGLPEKIFSRNKKAAQYGSGIKKIQERLGLKQW